MFFIWKCGFLFNIFGSTITIKTQKMKKTTLLSLAACAMFGTAVAQATYTIQAPLNNGSTSQFRAPNGSTLHASQRTVFYISAGELLPMNLSNITSVSFSLNGGCSSAVTGNFTLMLQNTNDFRYNKGASFSTAIAPMSTVYTGPYTIPATPSATNITLNLTTPFNYTGGGLYVAYDWVCSGPYSTSSATYACNNTLGWCATSDNTVTTGVDALGGSSFRPALRFFATNTASVEAEVTEIEALGTASKLRNTPQTIVSYVVNSGTAAISNVSVNLNITGANPFSNTKVINSLASGATATISFDPYNPTVSGVSTMSVSHTLSGDQDATNNSRVWTQSVTCAEEGITPPVAASSFITNNAYGIGTTGGYIYSVPHLATANSSITGVKLALANFPTYNVGKSLYAVLMDASFNIIATGNPITTTSGQLGTWIDVPFNSPQGLTANTPYAVGIAVNSASSPTFYPISILQGTYSPNYLPYSACYQTTITGGSTGYISEDYFGIRAIINYSNTMISALATKTIVCNNNLNPNTYPQSTTLTASGAAGLTYSWSTGATTSVVAVTPSITAQAGVISYTVTGTDGASGCVSNKAVVTLSLQNCKGIPENGDFGSDILVFPNPVVSGKVFVKGLEGSSTVTVYDILGNVVSVVKTDDEEISIDMKDKAAGNYIVKVSNEIGQFRTIKFINRN